MGVNEPPQGAPPPAPVAVQQTTVIQLGGHKSVGLAVLLAFLFGPLGMLYATVVGGVVMFFVNILVAFLTLGLGLFITIPLGMLWAGMAASSHNKQMQAVSAQAATGQVPSTAGSPAGWHDDPDGSGRLRFYDGARWTDHYSDKPGQPAAERAQATTASAELSQGTAEEAEAPTEVVAQDEEVTVVLKSAADKARCGSCGGEINPAARFCSSCGAQATKG